MTTTDAPVQGPQIAVPVDPVMAQEPAREIGDIFANKALVQPAIAAVVGVVAMTFKIAVDDALVDNLTTIVTFAAFVWAALAGQQEARDRAIAQAEQTRDVVYAPSTVADVVSDAARAGRADIQPVVVPRAKWGTEQVKRERTGDAPTV